MEKRQVDNRTVYQILWDDMPKWRRDALGMSKRPLCTSRDTDHVLMKKEDANNYSLILSLLGMEEEGDPVAWVRDAISDARDEQEKQA